MRSKLPDEVLQKMPEDIRAEYEAAQKGEKITERLERWLILDNLNERLPEDMRAEYEAAQKGEEITERLKRGLILNNFVRYLYLAYLMGKQEEWYAFAKFHWDSIFYSEEIRTAYGHIEKRKRLTIAELDFRLTHLSNFEDYQSFAGIIVEETSFYTSRFLESFFCHFFSLEHREDKIKKLLKYFKEDMIKEEEKEWEKEKKKRKKREKYEEEWEKYEEEKDMPKVIRRGYKAALKEEEKEWEKQEEKQSKEYEEDIMKDMPKVIRRDYKAAKKGEEITERLERWIHELNDSKAYLSLAKTIYERTLFYIILGPFYTSITTITTIEFHKTSDGVYMSIPKEIKIYKGYGINKDMGKTYVLVHVLDSNKFDMIWLFIDGDKPCCEVDKGVDKKTLEKFINDFETTRIGNDIFLSWYRDNIEIIEKAYKDYQKQKHGIWRILWQTLSK